MRLSEQGSEKLPKGEIGVMGEFICECGKECKSQRGLDIHRDACVKASGKGILEHEFFTNRFTVGSENRCPKCSQYGQSFRIVGPETWGCLSCGTQFTPGYVLDGWKRELVKVQWKRP